MKSIVPLLLLLNSVPLGTASADMAISDTGSAVSVSENGTPVLTYNYGRMNPPEGLDPEKYWRSSYVFPVYGLSGESISEDFPPDHYHHRGIFWSWPECTVGDRKMDPWTLTGVRQVFGEWKTQVVEADKAVLVVQNVWKFDDDPKPKVLELVTIVVHAREAHSRALDFRLCFQNISSEPVTIRGAADKGYGGFKFRLNAANKSFAFFTDDGPHEKDTFVAPTPWIDARWSVAATKREEGVAIFQHPSNPDYPHDGWMLRHYGIVGPAWPLEETYTLADGEYFNLRYRVVIHDGELDQSTIADLYDQYITPKQATNTATTR